MTIDSEPYKYIKKNEVADKLNIPTKVRRGRKHYDVSCETSPIIGDNNTKATNKKTNLETWRPSTNLVMFNDRNSNIGTHRVRKEINGKVVNKSSIVNMVSEYVNKPKNRAKEPLDSHRIKKILNYGKLCNEHDEITKDAYRVNMIDRSKTPEAIQMRKTQFNEYHLNAINGHISQITFA